MFKALGAISDGKEVIVEPVPNTNVNQRLVGMLIFMSLIRRRWRRSSHRVALVSQCL